MQAKNNNTPSPQNGQLHITGPAAVVAAAILAELEQPGPGRTVIELGERQPAITPHQALYLGALACNYLLNGEPRLATFDPIDLELAIPLLRQMAATIEKAPL